MRRPRRSAGTGSWPGRPRPRLPRTPGALTNSPPRQEAAWEQAEVLIETKNPRNYDIAVTLLSDLRALAERRGETAAFTSRFLALRQQHQRSPACRNASTGPVCSILRRGIWRRTLGALRPSRPAWGRKLMNTTNL